jgi:hypothetical protein
MSATTQADLALDQTRAAVGVAVQALSKVVVEGVYGTELYTQEYVTTLEDVMHDLVKIRRRLNG